MSKISKKQKLIDTDLKNKLSNIKLVVFDVDGTLTDGGLFYSKNGLELKYFNVKDGLAVTLLHFIGIKTVFLTSENSQIIVSRAKKLKIDYVIQNTHNKLVDLMKLVYENELDLSNVMYIGDDINDLDAIKEVGFSACPNDASEYIKDCVDFISTKNGGFGAVREIIEMFFESKNTNILEVYNQHKLSINSK